MNLSKKTFLHRLFRVAIIIKAMDGVLDLLTSALLLVAGSDRISQLIPFLTQKELLEDPQDKLANYLLQWSENLLPSTQFFIIFYLALHGLIKIGLVLAMKSHHHYAYRIAETILLFFVAYQLYRFTHTHSTLLMISIFIDLGMVLLIHNESKNLGSHSNP